MAILQKAVASTTAFSELVSENPRRTGLLLQNRDNVTFIISNSKTDTAGAIYLYGTGNVYLTRDQDCQKQWWVATSISTGSIRVMEFYAED